MRVTQGHWRVCTKGHCSRSSDVSEGTIIILARQDGKVGLCVHLDESLRIPFDPRGTPQIHIDSWRANFLALMPTS